MTLAATSSYGESIQFIEEEMNKIKNKQKRRLGFIFSLPFWQVLFFGPKLFFKARKYRSFDVQKMMNQLLKKDPGLYLQIKLSRFL